MFACIAVAISGAIRPQLSSISKDCILQQMALDQNLGERNASKVHGSSLTVCMPVDTKDDAMLYLARDAHTKAALRPFNVGDAVKLSLLPDRSQLTPLGLGTNATIHRVLSASALAPAFGASSVASASLASASPISSTGRYFDGERRVRLLSVLVEMDGLVAEYAGGDRSAREAWAAEQRHFMDEEYRFSTYGKIGFDHTNSRVVTVDLGQSVPLANTDCVERGFEIARLAAAALGTASEVSIDGILYYEPEGATPACGSNGYGTLGVCYVGLLSVRAPRSNFEKPHAPTPLLVLMRMRMLPPPPATHNRHTHKLRRLPSVRLRRRPTGTRRRLRTSDSAEAGPLGTRAALCATSAQGAQPVPTSARTNSATTWASGTLVATRKFAK